MRLVSYVPESGRRRRSATVGGVLLCAMIVAAPAVAHAGTGDSPRPVETQDESVDALLAILLAAPDRSAAAAVRSRLTEIWSRSGSAAADLLVARAGRLVEVGEERAASRIFDAAIGLAPGWPEGRRRRALLRASRGDTEAAEIDLATALRAEPRFFPAMELLSVLTERRGDRAAALAWARRAAAVDPADAALAERVQRLSIEVEGRPI
jgi:tetratricopeptide (TPR) repeat protein